MSISLEASLGPRGGALLIEPDDAARRSLQLMLQGWGYAVRSFSAAAPALADAYAGDAHLLLVAHCLLSEGSAILQQLRQRGWQGRAILLADSRTSALIGEAAQAGFVEVLEKPVGRLELLNALAR